MGGAYFRGTSHPSFWGHNCKTFCIADNAVEHRWIGSCPTSKWSRCKKNGGVLPVWWIIQITSDDKNLCLQSYMYATCLFHFHVLLKCELRNPETCRVKTAWFCYLLYLYFFLLGKQHTQIHSTGLASWRHERGQGTDDDQDEEGQCLICTKGIVLPTTERESMLGQHER